MQALNVAAAVDTWNQSLRHLKTGDLVYYIDYPLRSGDPAVAWRAVVCDYVAGTTPQHLFTAGFIPWFMVLLLQVHVKSWSVIDCLATYMDMRAPSSDFGPITASQEAPALRILPIPTKDTDLAQVYTPYLRMVTGNPLLQVQWS